MRRGTAGAGCRGVGVEAGGLFELGQRFGLVFGGLCFGVC
jgi:hypothetical protein